MLLRLIILVCSMLLSSVAWYSTLLDDDANMDTRLGVSFLASYLLWALYVVCCYLIVSLWCMFVDASRSLPRGHSLAVVLPWNAASLGLAFATGFVAFALFVGLLTILLVTKQQRLQRGLVPRATRRDRVAVNYAKGFAMTMPALTVPVILYAIGAHK